jgi:hypothetical protein
MIAVTREQHAALRELERAQATVLRSFGWSETAGRWQHKAAPATTKPYTTRDAMELTRAEPLRFGSMR